MTRVFKPWEGEDCSWMWAYQAAPRHAASFNIWISVVVAIIAALYLAKPTWAAPEFTGKFVDRPFRSPVRPDRGTFNSRKKLEMDSPM